MREEQDANDLEVGFRLGKTRFFHLEGVNVIRILDVLVNDRHVGLLRNLIGDEGDACRVQLDVVDENVRFGIM